MKKSVLILGAVMAFAAVQAQAETTVQDTDGNGTYSMEEMVAAYPALTAEAFAEIDANGDAAVDADELQAAAGAGKLPE